MKSRFDAHYRERTRQRAANAYWNAKALEMAKVLSEGALQIREALFATWRAMGIESR